MVRPKKKISSSFCPSPQSKFNLRLCSFLNCSNLGTYKAPKSRTELTSYLWFCLEHIQEYNKKWNYYKNLSPEEVAWEDDADRTWRRPRHSFGQTHLNCFFLYGHNSPFATTDYSSFTGPSPSLPQNIISALQLFHLSYPYSQDELKRTYRTLAKRHHPDLNKGRCHDTNDFCKIKQGYEVLLAFLHNNFPKKR